MTRTTENTPFTCQHCGVEVSALASGGYRNHCPSCLHSRHVDDRPGDRANPCRGLMAPTGVEFHPAKGLMIVHRCVRCGHVGRNRVADQSDSVDALAALMNRGAADDGASRQRYASATGAAHPRGPRRRAPRRA
ncbi:MAG TPA: RNHCP domain-containing protein [Micromonosporaceae bacterium]|nr:RNHCP domain-containing protein [Micromonosporaceae bacterium]